MYLTTLPPQHVKVSRGWGSNPGPCPYHGHALPTELSRQASMYFTWKRQEGEDLVIRTEDDVLCLRINLVDKRRGRVRELVGNLPQSDVRINELSFDGGGLVAGRMLFRTKRFSEVKCGVKVDAKFVVFSSVIKRGNIIIRRNPHLLIKKGQTSFKFIEDIEVFNFVGLLTEVVFNNGGILL